MAAGHSHADHPHEERPQPDQPKLPAANVTTATQAAPRATGHDHDVIDGHLWLDPSNARVITLALARVLAEMAPEHAELFQRNAEAQARRLDQLAAGLDQQMRPLAGRGFIVFHDAYQYFERRFGLSALGSVTVSPDVPPSATRITALRRKIAGSKAVCVFAEPQFQPRAIDSIIERTTARRGTLDPLGAALPAGPDHYFALLQALAADFAHCLGDPA